MTTKLSEITKAKILDLYFADKLSIEEIGRKLGIGHTTASGVIKRFGKYLRSHSEAQSLPEEFTREINSLYWDESLSIKEVAKRTEHSPKTILRHLKRSRGTRTYSDAAKIWINNPNHRRQVMSRRRPTNLETELIKIIEKFDLPYKYVGDGSFLIGNLNPDFVNINGAKVAIEVFGKYWHSPGKTRDRPLRGQETREKVFLEFGWTLVILWGQKHLFQPEEEIVARVREAERRKC